MNPDRITRLALYAGIAIPFLYYGIQALAAPFFPGFSVISTTASELGSDLSRCGWVFNGGIMALGVITVFASVGFLRALRRLGIHPAIAWATSVVIFVGGIQTLWAGYYPLPDPRHGGHPLFVLAMLSTPVFLAAAMWRMNRNYFLANVVLLAAMVPLMSGMVDTHAYRGIVQRVFALTVFVPIGLAAYVLSRRMRQARDFDCSRLDSRLQPPSFASADTPGERI